ncbi:hypothetical protein BDN67DRAFT_985637 [Paxillus ammoniavirescens]|nr:hypothetical protein BDN67DRAFT_985637 [Paxillus ammoniavirescens]
MYMSIPGHEHKRQWLLSRLEDLLNHKAGQGDQQLLETPQGGEEDSNSLQAGLHEAESHVDVSDGLEFHVIDEDIPLTSAPVPGSNTSPRLFNSWKAVIPTLINPFLQYLTRTLGKPAILPSSAISYYFASVTVQTCKCTSLQQVLVYHGLFLTAPSQPHMAVSVELLSFYRVLFECSCNAINALVSALNSHYTHRGF